jgi:hypothetical protein
VLLRLPDTRELISNGCIALPNAFTASQGLSLTCVGTWRPATAGLGKEGHVHSYQELRVNEVRFELDPRPRLGVLRARDLRAFGAGEVILPSLEK